MSRIRHAFDTSCRHCHHGSDAHEHYRPGRDCGLCACRGYQAPHSVGATLRSLSEAVLAAAREGARWRGLRLEGALLA